MYPLQNQLTRLLILHEVRRPLLIQVRVQLRHGLRVGIHQNRPRLLLILHKVQQPVLTQAKVRQPLFQHLIRPRPAIQLALRQPIIRRKVRPEIQAKVRPRLIVRATVQPRLLTLVKVRQKPLLGLPFRVQKVSMTLISQRLSIRQLVHQKVLQLPIIRRKVRPRLGQPVLQRLTVQATVPPDRLHTVHPRVTIRPEVRRLFGLRPDRRRRPSVRP